MRLSDYIKTDLADRLRNGSELPVCRITLKALSEHYNVSFTPVRMAIAELIDEGLLEKGPNRRLYANYRPARSPETSEPASPPEPPRDLYRIVVHDLVELCLGGEAIALRENAMAEKYDVSRTVVRNILHRLAGEGMLDHLPRRGWRLKPFHEPDLKSFTEVRVLLELKALDLAIPKLHDEDLERMLKANAPPESPGDPPRSDESLHDYFIKLAGNPYIEDFLGRPASRYYRLLLKWEEAQSREITFKVAGEHREVLTALLERRWDAARRALSEHILDNNRFCTELDQLRLNPAERKQIDRSGSVEAGGDRHTKALVESQTWSNELSV